MSGIQYPVDLKDICKFEYQNNISVNVYGYEDKTVRSLRITTVTSATHHVYLLKNKESHYVLVKNLITYWWKTWADWYWDNIIMTRAKYVSANIVCIAASVKRYWKNIWKDPSYTGGRGTKIQAPKNWRQKGAWQSQVCKSRIPTTFTFCHLRELQKRIM